MPTLVYRYGLRAPTQGAEIVEEQMRAAHRYRNRLVELERARRAKMRELEAGDDVSPDLAALAPAVRSVVKSNPILGALAEIAQIVRSINAEDLTHTTQLRRVLTLASRALIAGAQSAGVPLTPAR